MENDKDYWVKAAGRRLGILDSVEWELNKIVSLFNIGKWALVGQRLEGLLSMVQKHRRQEETGKDVSKTLLKAREYAGADFRE